MYCLLLLTRLSWGLLCRSPDEVALVKFAEEVGLSLEERTRSSVILKTPNGTFEEYTILQMFPFTSDRKRMGIIVQHAATKEIVFFLKGYVIGLLIRHTHQCGSGRAVIES